MLTQRQREYGRAYYYRRDREKRNAKDRAYYQAHREVLLEKQKQRRTTFPKGVAAHRIVARASEFSRYQQRSPQ